MCFSAAASFATAAVLIPLGGYTLKTAWQKDQRYLGWALFPLFFGIQQALEGGVWLALGREDPSQVHSFALGFLFFAYFVWPFLIPFSAFLVEDRSGRRLVFLALSIVGFLIGLSLFFPLLVDADRLPITIERHSIAYNSRLIWDAIAPTSVLRVVYAGIVCVPLLLSSVKSVRIFGVLIALSVIAGFLFALHAFTSVWCFMAAIISAFILFVVRGLPRH